MRGSSIKNETPTLPKQITGQEALEKVLRHTDQIITEIEDEIECMSITHGGRQAGKKGCLHRVQALRVHILELKEHTL